ncbi:putative LRR receptor-like serine/threonine-protein kinase [Hibiscus syriacus]|uniref:LRR receptor-like serine/threonine-protein kinase n=1 Tax=Hibiscus syriacus TaxID=106335 RepID=A0A6A3CJH8_HIBSY|nr:putative LRR receptor-like serine/threonine-protein kinase [Hibiscus syriacus]
MGQLPSQDILTLLEFKKDIKHDPTGYVLDSWNEESIDFNGCPSWWNGIVCNGGNVAGVILENLGLSVDADLSVFSNLIKLVKLLLSNSSIASVIPDNVGDFKSLKFLDVSNNLFSSALPLAIGKLESVRNLSLAENNFSGSIPVTISGLASIQSLDLSRNSLSGTLPTSLTELNELLYLNLSFNQFTKSIPKGFELIYSLQVLDLRGNMLDGSLSGEFSLLSNASHVDFSMNMLQSSSPQKLLPGISERVKFLNLSHNQLTGSLVGEAELQLFGNLKVLDLSYNQLSGELPGFNFAYDLQVLKLSNNIFMGFIPNVLLKGDSLLLTELDLSGSNITGPISMIMSTNLQILNLSSNGITGELPLLTGSCVVLHLLNNKLEGNLTRMSKWGNIEYLDLSQNRLTGSIPELTPQFLRLNHFNLSHNSLTSSLPKVILQYPNLRVLDLGFNQLDGPFLNDLLNLDTLEELHLGSNLFTGAIKFSPLSESNLHVLDLSHNRLNGYFPNQFGSLSGLQVLNLAGNNITGSLPTSLADMKSLSSLDISHNNLTGSLPNKVPNGLKGFNVSYNDLSGVVPETLRKFPSSSFYPGNSNFVVRTESGGPTVVSAVDVVSSRKGSSSEIINPGEKMVAVPGYPPSKTSHLSWSPESGDSFTAEHLARSPDQLVGELHFLDDTITLTPEELSRAPAEVLGSSSHGTSYRATLDNGLFLTVKWLREGVAKQRKEFAKEAKKFMNIRHPNVVGLRGYYWGPTQHEKLILSDYISPGSLASFLYDGPDLNARVSDYCLHRLMTQAGTMEQILDAGLLEYRAPELADTKKPLLSFKSDVYTFGVILLELLTGKCAGDVIPGEEGIGLIEWVRLKVAEGSGSDCFDSALAQEMGNLGAEKGMKEGI